MHNNSQNEAGILKMGFKNPEFMPLLKNVFAADKPLLQSMMVYGIAISLLSLATPISVQLLINSVSFTAIFQPIMVLGLILLLMVSLYGIVNLLQIYIAEVFQRRFFARMGCEIGMSLLNAHHQAFEETNKAEMVNRFFETVIIQKTIPKLFNKTFTAIFQSIAGLALIACYHPFFLVFSFGIPLSIFLIWKVFSPKAIIHSFLESKKKYELVSWLEDIAQNHLLFKSSEGRNYGKFKIDYLTGLYLKERISHFRSLFSQVILLYVLYAILTAFLLILGGWLVIKGQLSIGQLVASELVISSILFNIISLGRDFESVYDIIASSEKLTQFQNIPQETNKDQLLDEPIAEIGFEDVLCNYLGHEYRFDFQFVRDKNYLIFTNGYSTRKVIIEMILGFRSAISGRLSINKINIENLDKYALRSRIAIINNSSLIEGTIRQYLTFNHSDISDSQIMNALKKVGLHEIVNESNNGLDSKIIPSGWPFSESEKILLKIARALLAKPQIIIADEVIDMLEPNIRSKVLLHLTKEHQAAFLYFSHRYDNFHDFDHKILIEKTFSREIKNLEEFNKIQ